MPAEDLQPQPDADFPRSSFGSRHAVLDKNGETLRGFTTEEHHSEFWTAERRAAQSRKAKELMAQGKFGGQNGFHRRRTKKFQELAAEHAQEKAERIIEKLDAMIDQPKDKRLQLEAIREYMKMEAWSVQNARDDEKDFKKLSGKELDSRLLSLMGEALGIDFSQFVEAFAQPITDAEVVDGHELTTGETAYDPMDTELGGDRLRAGAEMKAAAECEACQEERGRVIDLLRDSGVEDDELISLTAVRARCEDHREPA